jgi:hypothetical protein
MSLFCSALRKFAFIMAATPSLTSGKSENHVTFVFNFLEEVRPKPLRYTDCVRARPPDPEHLKLLLPCGEAIRKLALAARKLILEEAPEASEFVYEVYTIADHFAFTEKPGGAFVFTTTHAKWVNLGFNFGALLPDPHGLLRGEGKWIRHVRIAQGTDLDVPGVRDLVRAAIAQADRPEGKPRKPHTVIHAAQSAGRRPAARRRAEPRA